MKLAPFFLALVLAIPVDAAEKSDIRLANEKVLKAARVVAIGETHATIVHAGGMDSVELDDVPLDILARASMEIEAKKAERQQHTEAAAKQAAIEQEKREEEIRVRLAMANMRAQAQGDAQVAIPSGRMVNLQAIEKQLPSLKASVPPRPNASSADPLVRDLVSKYVRAFAQISPATIGQNVSWLRDNIANDIAANQKVIATTKPPKYPWEKTATSSMRASAQQNLAWLRNLLAHVQKFEALAQ